MVTPLQRITQSMQGLQSLQAQNLQMDEARRQIEQREQAAQSRQEAMQLLDRYKQSVSQGQPDYDSLSKAYMISPELTVGFKKITGIESEQAQKQATGFMFAMNQALESGDIQSARQLAEQRVGLLQREGRNPEQTAGLLEQIKLGNIDQAKQAVKSASAGLYGAGAMGKDVYERIAPQQKEQKPTGLQKEYRQAVEQGFEGSLMDYQKALSSDPSQDLEMMKLQAQIADIQDRQQQRQADRERTDKLQEQKTKKLVRGVDNVIGEVDKAITQAKGDLATGVGGALTGSVPGTPAYKLRSRIQTVKANLGFDRLQQMRDASPTGGALGQVSERELSDLQSTVANLDPNQGREQLLENLEKVRRHYTNWKQTLVGENPDDTETEDAGNTVNWEDL